MRKILTVIALVLSLTSGAVGIIAVTSQSAEAGGGHDPGGGGK